MSTMILSPNCLRLALPSLLIMVFGSVDAAAKIRSPYIDDNQLCRAQPLPAVVLHLTGDAWKLDPKGKASPLLEGMTIDEQEGVKTSSTAFVSLLLGDGSRVVLPASSQVRLHLEKKLSIPQVVLEQGQAEAYVIKRASDHDRFQIVTPVGVLGVRGTHFRVRNDAEQSVLEVLEGQVAVKRDMKTKPVENEVKVGARQGLLFKTQGELKPVELLAAPKLVGQDGQKGDAPVWSLYLRPLPGAQRYRAQVATDKAFMNIKQENFSSVPKMSFTGLKASFYHVRLSAYDENGLEGETGVYDIFYYPPTTQAHDQ
ncbi:MULTISPECIES: FecR family protein [Pseudomonas]|uniref:FecR domain-containing protein n=2 Tax=Pseudomonas TaxID=286 RepID=A0A8H9YUY9_9PSED|nr:FecR domain-containing protein [Pseudomonas sp. SWRI144]MBW8128205.1 FecR domain-containing protein [Pseudomonas sp. LAP_36]MBW8137060.1 FecR domain-containing protein [Pseudomonas sp. PAMC 26818]QXH84100.1 FecR domain-containing protein [Pseudomonas tritici]CRM85321.1 FecR protein [Pseudomonas sp. 35 E 8]